MIEPRLLHAYVDGELSAEERQKLETELAECQDSQAEIAAIRNLKSLLGNAENVECADVWASCKSRLDAIDRVKKSGNFITKYSWAFVTGVAMFILIGGGYARHTQAGSVDSSSLAGILSSSNRNTPETQVRNEELDKILGVANRNLSQFRIIGQQNVVIDGQPARRIDLADVQGRLSLIVLPQITSFDGMDPDRNAQYFFGQIDPDTKAVGWRVKDAALVLVGQREYSELRDFAYNHLVRPE
ncbi:MAG: zf-HC2 domain-containing protein [Armatimonadetes bacterium]|nr:hypothetical protein [Armatimonadota bacterium]MBS1703560.1 zf-HC2 domain-containing protein [Armatimonadota bacterium]MBS1729001.1 zf-HC2 domain-containing protein [Armatimonadota bacterium]